MVVVGVKPRPYFTFAFVFGVVVTLFRIYYISLEKYGLYADEAQYWTWAQSFEWGYFSKPPVIAWLILATTEYCGDTPFCIRLSAPILHFLTSLFVYGIGTRLYRPQIGFWSAFTYITLPGVTASSAFIATDAPFLLFWAAALYYFIIGLEHWHIKWWVLAGIAAGLGMMSKYTMGVFLISAITYCLVSKNSRLYLTSFKFWLSVGIAAAIYVPNLLWNAGHDFVSYQHTKANANIQGLELHWDNLVEFLGAQFGVFGPIPFALLISLLLLSLLARKKDEETLLLSFILPMLAIISLVSLLSRAHANWASTSYIAATVLIVSWLVNTNKYYLVKLSILLHILAAIAFANYDIIVRDVEGIPVNEKTDPFRRVRGWDDFTNRLTKIHQVYPQAYLVSDERKIVATLMYRLRDEDGNPANILKWNADKITHDHYDLTTDMNSYKDKDFLFITREGTVEHIAPYFNFALKAGEIITPLYPGYERRYQLYYLQGFKGY